jgi:hypothetical protein
VPVNFTAGNIETAQTAVKVIQGDSGPYKSQHFNVTCHLHSTNHAENAILSVFSEFVKKTKIL